MNRLANSTWTRVLVAALVPLLGVGLLVWSTSDRGDKIDRIPVAVVNNDKIITGSQPMAAGRALAGALTDPKTPDKNLDWILTDSDDANTGLANGTYYAVLTIPSQFSQDILSTGTDKPVQGKVSLVSNSAASVTVPYISQQVAAAAADSLGVQSTQGYLKNVYAGFNQIASSNQKAASSAASLADGTSQLAKGAGQLDSGAGELSGSLAELQTGAFELQTAAESLADGADTLRTGASSVSTGAGTLETGMGELASSSTELARSSGDLATASRAVSDGAGGVATATRRLSQGDRLLTLELRRLARVCARRGGSRTYCNAVERAHNHAELLTRGSVAVSRAASDLAAATSRLSTGTGRVAQGNTRLSTAARRLDGASSELSSGADQVSSGATSLAQGAGTLAQSTGSLANGAQQAASAGASLASGASNLSSSATQVDSGAQQLSSGLASGAKQSPTYSDSQQNTLATVVSQPVVLSHSLENDQHANGWLIALLVALVLWMAALLGGLRRDVAASIRAAGLPISSVRLVISEVLPGLGLALVEGVAVLVALLVLRVSVASLVPFALLTLVAALTFTLLAYATRLLFGRAGVPVFVVFLLLQGAALGSVVPLETAPGLMRLLNGILPLTMYVNGASQLISGGQVESPIATLAVLLVWGLAAFLLAVFVVGRRRVRRAVSGARLTAGSAVA